MNNMKMFKNKITSNINDNVNEKKKYNINNKENVIDIILMVLPFIFMSNTIRLFMSDKAVYTYKIPVFIIVILINIMFDFLYIFLVVSISKNVKGIMGKIIYAVAFFLFYIMFLTNAIYYKATGYVFSLNLTKLAGEGSKYIKDVALGSKWYVYASAIVILGIFLLAIIRFKTSDKNNIKEIIFTILVFAVLHTMLPLAYGQHIYEASLEEWHIPRNVYDNFNDANKSIKVCGLYEYTIKDFFVSFFYKEEEISDEDKAFLDSIYNDIDKEKSNGYTGMFEGKNVIFLQLEGIDYWLFDEETMPNMCSLKEHGIVFNDHYSYYNGAGSTFNSEFAVNTGFVTPITFYKNPTFLYTNTFVNTLPMLFKERGYRTSAFHMNTSEFYNRGLNYDAWGYDNYYSLMDMEDYRDLSYELDRELIENETFNKLIFDDSKPFLDYIITYTPHTPFSTKEDVGKFLAEDIYGKGNAPDLSAEDSVRLMASETDRMIGLLIDGLKKHGLYNNTVIVTYADHYLYLMDEDVLAKYKDMDSNLINHTPFLIWSADIEETINIDKTNSQLDILPTSLNLFGFEVNTNSYIGRDILSDDYEGYVFFDDLSWYDGNVYVENGIVTSGENYDESVIDNINKRIKKLVDQNDLTLKYNYFKYEE